MMKKIIFLLLVVLFTTDNYAQIDTLQTKKTRLKTMGTVFKNSYLSISGDVNQMGHSISDDWKKTGYYTAGIVGLILTDKITTNFWHKTIEPNITYSLPNISPVKSGKTLYTWVRGNDAYMTFPFMGLYIGAVIANKERGQYAALNAFKAIAYSELISQLALKTIFGRNRPNRPLDANNPPDPWTTNNWDFFNTRQTYLGSSAEASAFPSLHATAFFALAKVAQMEYDNYWIPYGFMSLVFLADIKGHNHWVSDIVVGGIVGTIIGRSVVKSSWKIRGKEEFLKKKKNISFRFVPQVTPNWTGLHIVGSF